MRKGLLTLEDTDGIELKWGNAKAMLQMTEKMAKREGKLGNLLADGVKKASEKIKGSRSSPSTSRDRKCHARPQALHALRRHL